MQIQIGARRQNRARDVTGMVETGMHRLAGPRIAEFVMHHSMHEMIFLVADDRPR